MIQWRNFNIDPDWYLGKIGVADTGECMGIKQMMELLREEFPDLKFGYFNYRWKEWRRLWKGLCTLINNEALCKRKSVNTNGRFLVVEIRRLLIEPASVVSCFSSGNLLFLRSFLNYLNAIFKNDRQHYFTSSKGLKSRHTIYIILPQFLFIWFLFILAQCTGTVQNPLLPVMASAYNDTLLVHKQSTRAVFPGRKSVAQQNIAGIPVIGGRRLYHYQERLYEQRSTCAGTCSTLLMLWEPDLM